MSADATTKPAPIPARHTLISLGIAVQRALEAWDSTVLPAASDGALQEAMETLRAAAQSHSLTTDYAIQVTVNHVSRWLVTQDLTHCITDLVHVCDRFETEEEANAAVARLRERYADKSFEVRPVTKLMESGS